MLYTVIAIVIAIALLFAWLLKPQPPCHSHVPSKTVDWTKRRTLSEAVAAEAPKTGLTYLVVGTGSVGLALINALLERGEKNVRGFDVREPRRSPSSSAFTFIRGSVGDVDALTEACKGADVVFSTFAVIKFQERLPFQYALSHSVNVEGTENLVRACLAAGVKHLVQTSTSNVCVFADGSMSGALLDEDSPQVTKETSPNHYGWTKVQAEKIVLAANGQPLARGGTLSTAAVRPCSAIFGPDDNFISETWIRAGALQIILPAPKIDYVHVDNVLWGHLLCEKALREKTEEVGGHAFCVNGGEPSRSADDFYAAVAHFYEQATGEAMAVTRLPTRLLRVIAFAVECYQRLTQTRLVGELGNLTPAMFATAELSYGFSSAKAKRLLGYEPLYTVDEGLQKTTAEHFAAGNCVKSNKTMWGAAAKVAPKKA